MPEVTARLEVAREGEAGKGLGLELGEARQGSALGHLPIAWIPIRAAGREFGGVVVP